MKVLLIRNPVSGNLWQGARFEEAEKSLQKSSLPYEVKVTAGKGDATRFASEARERGFSHVAVFGGDGTVREAAQGLAGSEVILVPLPGGTANLLAHELNLDLNDFDLARFLTTGQVRLIDVGRAALGSQPERSFILMAGIGMDAVAVRGVDPKLKRWLGWILYILSGFWHVSRHRPFRATLHFQDPARAPVKVRAWVIVVGNARAYGIPGIRVASKARLDDGLLDLCVFQSRSLLHFIGHFFKVLRNRHLEDESVSYYQTKSVRIETSGEVPVQLDGDLVGNTPIELSIAPARLRALIPAAAKSQVSP
ncbi:MAG: diacylglycerol kinase family lipid kinase [Candidatus Omnitrophica bacterium]|nr:diacylglycerol kinase family lipid kinase [Candidatus Omnitrophota bacterium]